MLIGLDNEVIEKGYDDEKFVKELIKDQSLYLLPGKMFDAPNAVRMLMARSKEQTEDAVNRLVEFVNKITGTAEGRLLSQSSGHQKYANSNYSLRYSLCSKLLFYAMSQTRIFEVTQSNSSKSTNAQVSATVCCRCSFGPDPVLSNVQASAQVSNKRLHRCVSVFLLSVDEQQLTAQSFSSSRMPAVVVVDALLSPGTVLSNVRL
ncbi:hypothetical protein Ddc_11816 [Ditylenchus destructor]|nr:hypothetical protein Ddc_11816 [Ditylenchus destructor]